MPPRVPARQKGGGRTISPRASAARALQAAPAPATGDLSSRPTCDVAQDAKTLPPRSFPGNERLPLPPPPLDGACYPGLLIAVMTSIMPKDLIRIVADFLVLFGNRSSVRRLVTPRIVSLASRVPGWIAFFVFACNVCSQIPNR